VAEELHKRVKNWPLVVNLKVTTRVLEHWILKIGV